MVKNAAAHAVRTPLFRKRVVQSKKVHSRKGAKRHDYASRG